MKSILISGAFGQDGRYLVDYLKSNKDLRIVCTGRSFPKNNFTSNNAAKIEYLKLNIDDESEIIHAIKKYQPDEIYHLASFSAPSMSWDQPKEVISTNGISTIYFLDALRLFSKHTRFFFASTAKIFGSPCESPQNENTPVNPSDPYSLGKYMGHQAVKLYRNMFGLFACNGILYNHESAQKNSNFVVYKICKQAIELKLGKRSFIELFSLDSQIDFGDPRDYVKAMSLILNQNIPSDYIISSSTSHSIKEICCLVEKILCIDNILSQVVVKNTTIKRDSKAPLGNNEKLKAIGWSQEYTIEETIQKMISDIQKN